MLYRKPHLVLPTRDAHTFSSFDVSRIVYMLLFNSEPPVIALIYRSPDAQDPDNWF